MRYRFVTQDEPVKVVVTGGTGVIGRAAVGALVGAGHAVAVLHRPGQEADRNSDRIRARGAAPVAVDLFDADALAEAFEGADAVVNLATSVPVGYAAVLPQSWRRNDDLRTRGAGLLAVAARTAGVRRVIQGSASFLYADGGDSWITEKAALDITPATEPVAVAEAHVQDYAGGFRSGVLLRFGTIVGDDPQTRFWLKAAANGRPVGLGRADQWSHLVHTDDLGTAVLAALDAPSGVYNIGAAPVLRGEVVDGYAKAAGVPSAAFLGPVLRRFAGARIEPMSRSLRVSSDLFTAQTGWQPTRPAFDPAWFDAAERETLDA